MKTASLLVAAGAIVALIVVLLQRSAVEPSVIGVPIPTAGNSGELGIATVIGLDGQTKVTLNLSGGFSLKATQPANIHEGTCRNLGPVRFPLNPANEGVSASGLDISLKDFKKELPLAINILKSESEAISVACGDIEF